MINFIQDLSLTSGALVIALISPLLVFSVLRSRQRYLPWIASVVVPLVLAYVLYWLPGWRSGNTAEYSAWEALVVPVWAAAGAFVSLATVSVWAFMHRVRRTPPN